MVHVVLAGSVLIALLGRARWKNTTWISFIILFLFAAFRYMYGNDYSSYYNWYEYIRNGGTSPYTREYLFSILNEITPSFFILIAVTSGVFLYTIYRMIKNNLPLRCMWVGAFIFVINPYLFLMNLSAIRQCIAMLLFIASIEYAMNKRLLPYVIHIVIAALFHNSAILLLPIYFVINMKQIKRKHVIIVVLLLGLFLLVVDVNSIALQLAEVLNKKDYVYHASQSEGNSFRATLLTAITLVYVLGNLPSLEGKSLVYGKLYLIALVMGVLAFKMSMLTRFQMYFDIFSVVVLPTLFYNTVFSKKDILKIRANNVVDAAWKCMNEFGLPILIVIVYFLRYYSFFINPMWQSFVHYQTIFSAI